MISLSSSTDTRVCLILSYTPLQVCYYLQPLTFDPFYLSVIHSLITAWHRGKSEQSVAAVWLFNVWGEKSFWWRGGWGVHPHSTWNKTQTQQGTIPPALPVRVSDRSHHTQFTHTLSSGVLPWWAVCQCPNLILLGRAGGHGRYINSLSRTAPEWERVSLCVWTFKDLWSTLLPWCYISSCHQ